MKPGKRLDADGRRFLLLKRYHSGSHDAVADDARLCPLPALGTIAGINTVGDRQVPRRSSDNEGRGEFCGLFLC